MYRLAGFLIRLLSVPLLLGVAAVQTLAGDLHAGPGDYRQALARLAPGDRLVLKAGDYLRGLPLHGLAGESGRPIVIEGPAAGAPARFIARAGANTVSLVDVRHVVVRNLELDGRNLPVDAVKAEGHARHAHFVTLENLHIHDHAASQQNVGISSKCPAFGWVVRGNRIERVGTGMYFGDSDGSDPFVAGLIEGNHVRDTLGYNLQIKHQKGRPVDMPETGPRHDTVIRHNFFSKESAQPGATGPLSRPNLLVGHFPVSGEGSADRYLIHANLFWQNPSEALFQGEGNLALYNNLFVTTGPDALRIQPHNDVPRTVRVQFNTVLSRGNGITLRVPENSPFEQIVVGNVVFAKRPIDGGTQRHNLSGGYDAAGRYLVKPYAGLGEIDLSPQSGRFFATMAAEQLRSDLPDIELDHAGRARPPGTLGALIAAGRP